MNFPDPVVNSRVFKADSVVVLREDTAITLLLCGGTDQFGSPLKYALFQREFALGGRPGPESDEVYVEWWVNGSSTVVKVEFIELHRDRLILRAASDTSPRLQAEEPFQIELSFDEADFRKISGILLGGIFKTVAVFRSPGLQTDSAAVIASPRRITWM